MTDEEVVVVAAAAAAAAAGTAAACCACCACASSASAASGNGACGKSCLDLFLQKLVSGLLTRFAAVHFRAFWCLRSFVCALCSHFLSAVVLLCQFFFCVSACLLLCLLSCRDRADGAPVLSGNFDCMFQCNPKTWFDCARDQAEKRIRRKVSKAASGALEKKGGKSNEGATSIVGNPTCLPGAEPN